MSRRVRQQTVPTIITPTLELTIRPIAHERYSVEPRLFEPGDGLGPRLIDGPVPVAALRGEELLALQVSPHAYGLRLGQMLFNDARLRSAFRRACDIATAHGDVLRLRLRLDGGSATLHAIAWEMLCYPEDGRFLSTSARVLLTRYHDSAEALRLEVRSRPGLHALIAVSSPRGLSGHELAQIDPAGEVELCRSALGDITVDVVASDAQPGQATYKRIADALQRRPDIFYLVCHGAHVGGETALWLEREDGLAELVRGEDFVALFRNLAHPPALTVLVACHSGGQIDDECARVALGPRLVEAGCPSVIAVRGNMSLELGGRFFQSFFQRLCQDGQVEQALAAARNATQMLEGWWRPVLYTRLAEGRLWAPHTPGRIFSGVPNVPLPTIPREALGRAIVDYLDEQSASPGLENVYGIRGSGKTTLVASILRCRHGGGHLAEVVLWGDLGRSRPEDLLWTFLDTVGETVPEDGAARDMLRDTFWSYIEDERRPFIIVLDGVLEAEALRAFLPATGGLPKNCRLIAISITPLQAFPGLRMEPLEVGPLERAQIKQLFDALLGKEAAKRFEAELEGIARIYRGHAQLVALAALRLSLRDEHPAAFLDRLELIERETGLADTRINEQLDLSLQGLESSDILMFDLLGVLGAGDWQPSLLAATSLRSPEEVEAALDQLGKRGLICRGSGGRYRVDGLTQGHAAFRFRQLPAHQQRVSKYLFARACLDLAADAYTVSAASPAEPSPDEREVGSGLAGIAQRYRSLLLPELPQIRQALVWARMNPEWGLLQRFADLAVLDLQDEPWTNAPIVRTTLVLATLHRPIFWATGKHLRYHAAATLASQEISAAHPAMSMSLSIADAYSYVDRLVWPRLGSLIQREQPGVEPELSLNLVASRIVDGVVREYALVDARWCGVLAAGLVLSRVDLVGAQWIACELSESVWLHCDARGVSLSGCRLAGAALERVILRGADLAGCDLGGATLTGVDLRGANLQGANLRGAILKDVDMSDADLRGASLEGARFEGLVLSRALLARSVWHGSVGRPFATDAHLVSEILVQQERPADPQRQMRRRVPGATILARPLDDYDDADLRGVTLADAVLALEPPERLDLAGADMRGADLRRLKAPRARLAGSNLRAADMAEAELPLADLGEADLTGAQLPWAQLPGARLSGARLRYARLEGADLSGADLSGADLLAADLTGANLVGADLSGATLIGADLRNAVVTREQLASVARLDQAMLVEDDEVFDVLRLSGRYRRSIYGFDAGANLRYSWCSGHFDRWPFEGCDLYGAKLSGSFRELSLARVIAIRARLDGSFWRVCFCSANLDDAVLSGAFVHAHFLHADLRRARLSGLFAHTSFAGARLIDADLKGASFVNADLSGAYGVDTAMLRQAYRLRGTLLPWGERYDGRFALAGDCADALRYGVNPRDELAMAAFFASERSMAGVLA